MPGTVADVLRDAPEFIAVWLVPAAATGASRLISGPDAGGAAAPASAELGCGAAALAIWPGVGVLLRSSPALLSRPESS